MTARCRARQPARQQLSLGISDHAAGPELVPLLERLHAMSSQLALAVTIGFSREMLDAYDAGELDAVVVRQEGSRRGGEKLTEDEFGWFAAKRLPGGAARRCRWRRWRRPAACARSPSARSTRPASHGASALSAVASPPWPPPPWPGLAVAPLARRIAPPGLVDIGPAQRLPRLASSKVMLHSKVSDPAKLRGIADAGGDVSGAWSAFAVTDRFVKKTDF